MIKTQPKTEIKMKRSVEKSRNITKSNEEMHPNILLYTINKS